MRKFIINILRFISVTIIVTFLLQSLISIRIKNKSITGYDNWDITKNINADLVLLGSSRCWAHLDPRFFEKNYHLKTINIGMNGHSELPATILRLKNYLAKNNAPKFAVLSFDPFTIPGSFENNSNFINKNNYARFAYSPCEENVELVNYFKYDYKEKYIPLYAIFKYQLFKDALTLDNENIFKEGFELNDEKWDTLKYPITSSMKKYYIKHDKIKNLKVQLQMLKSLCISNKIQLICIQTPVYKSNYDELVFENPGSICKKLNIPFIDTNSANIRNNINNFYNSSHLNKNGILEMNKVLKNKKELKIILK